METHYCPSMSAITDILGQTINEGDVFVWTRGTGGGWTCVGIVQKISEKGTISARIFKSGKAKNEEGMTVRVGRRASGVVINDDTTKRLVYERLKM